GAEGFAKKFLPDTSDILYATDLLDQGETEELTFTAPAEVGEYPYICTFPGHAMIMRGVLTVE
ncbi:MAG: plastocyanin/azurin family copper-binding protein, partial [Verrucomicrobiota bacterium]